MKRKLTTKLMETKMKNSWTVDDFCNYLGCSEEEFWKVFEIAFSDKAQVDYKRKLDQNQKNREKAVVKSKKRGGQQQPLLYLSRVQSPEEITVVETAKAEENIEIQQEETKKVTSETILDELKTREEKLQKEICDIEAAKCALDLQKREIRIDLQNKKDQLVLLQTQARKLGDEVQGCIEQMQEVSLSIEEIKVQMSEKKQQLDNVRNEIKGLEKIILVVYANGEVEIDGPGTNEFIVSEVWETIFQKLRDDELVEDLTNRQIKLLAKVICYINTVENCDVTFEVPELQQVFEKIPDNGLKYYF